MKIEPSKVARLVIAYYEQFDSHVPEWALCHLDAGDLSARLRDALASGVPLRLTWVVPRQYPKGGCIVRFYPERATPKRGPDGRWRK